MKKPLVKSARFVISNTDINKCPNDGKPEYAFIGRSNVGKSSLINMVTGHRKLAMTSATPGKTLLITLLSTTSGILSICRDMAMQREASRRMNSWNI